MKKSEKINSETLLSRSKENCANPWDGECKGTDIVLYIRYKSDNLPICRECWTEIADTEVEWSDKHAFP